MKKVAIITGATKGVGLASVKALSKVFAGDVYLTATNEESGLAAVKALKRDYGITVHFHVLNISK